MRYVATTAFLLLLGMLTGATALSYSAIALLAVFIISRHLAFQWAQAVHVQRQVLTPEIEVGQSVTVGLTITNESGWFIPWVIVEDFLSPRATRFPPKALQVTGKSIRLCLLRPRQRQIMTYTLQADRRGFYQIGPTVIETGDLFGLFRHFHVASPPDYLLVLPKLEALEGYDVRSRRPIGEIRVAYRTMEDPTLLLGIREYLPGDPMNRVDWRATARTGKLHSKIFQPTSVAGAMIVLDLHRQSNPDRHEPVRSDLAVVAAASIAHTLYIMQQQFGLVANGRDAAERVRLEGWETDFRSRDAALGSVADDQENARKRPLIVPAGRGPEHFQELNRQLARLERNDGLTLPELLLESQSRLPRDASVIAIVQEVDETAALALGMLARQGYAVSAIVNHFEPEALRESAGRLMAFSIPVYGLPDKSSIPQICRSMLLRY
jgi:uncharacterized protein (DUF58 family)